ncbi:PEP/pyruvate-binding domain-containing protein [Streptomyces sp. NPDC060022]|uniref:PEP/pyruvate-binding domain-containing protein n=1 Tax=Streptomyces sp. NPDC060022 TaxID=3347039 RepID=UPI003682FC0B
MSCVLLVHDRGGSPLEYVVPKVTAQAAVHVFAVAPLPQARRGLWQPLCVTVQECGLGDGGKELVEQIKDRAAEVGADAILTFSEFAFAAVAQACEDLGLAGAGPGAKAACNVLGVRGIRHRAGVPVPGFARVGGEGAIKEAFGRLRPPLRLKSAGGTGESGQAMLFTEQDAVAQWRKAKALKPSRTSEGYGDPRTEDLAGDFFLEELVTGSTEGWFENPGWGDCVSVEGIVADGIHHALFLTGRLPAFSPFTEGGSVTPVALPELLQRRIERVVCEAVDVLGLDTCATHTEVRLGAGGRLWVIGTAVHFGGVLIAREAEEVYGFDMIAMLVRQLLGRPVRYPRRMLTDGYGAAASLVVVPADEPGRTWPPGEPVWDFTAVDWPAILAPDTSIQLVPGLTDPDDAYEAAYGTHSGGRSRSAVCFVTGRDAGTVLADCTRVVQELPALLGSCLRPDLFDAAALAELAEHRQVKVVVDRENGRAHVLDRTEYALHTHFIADRILGIDPDTPHADIDAFDHRVYQHPDRRFLRGVLSLHDRSGDAFMALESMEADTMGAALLIEFHAAVRARLHPAMPLYIKPANRHQAAALEGVPAPRLPRLSANALHGTEEFTALNTGRAHGRLRHFTTLDAYAAAARDGGIAWYDILALPVVPDDVQRVAGLISTRPATWLSPTTVLAAGWGIPYAVIRDLTGRVEGLDVHPDGTWVHYTVTADEARLEAAEPPTDLSEPARHREPLALPAPITELLPIVPLSRLRSADHTAYGTEAANLGELHHVLHHGSPLLTHYYTVPRPPRPHLLRRLADRLGAPRDSSREQLATRAGHFLRRHLSVPEGIAVPFAVQRDFLAASPGIQQRIGMLRTALTHDRVFEIDALCAELRDLVRTTVLPEHIFNALVSRLVRHVAGTGALVVRPSSDAEKCPGFPAVALPGSVTQVTDLSNLAAAIRRVWASAFSPKGVRLLHRAGHWPDETGVGVIVQRSMPCDFGGLMVTCEPTRREDFRNVVINFSTGFAATAVDRGTLPHRFLCNTVEGGGRATSSTDDPASGLDFAAKERLSRLALAGRLLQGHFSDAPDHDTPLDVEWLLGPDGRLMLVRVSPYTP